VAVFVHFTDENNKNSIIKNGIKTGKIHYENIKKGIFCMPVIPDFYATHQWVREIKQYNSGNNIIAIYFRIPDDEILFCGKYTEEMICVKATETHKIYTSKEDKMGFQAILTRKVSKNEITKIKNISQITGWRHYPKSHEKKRCLCPACLSKGSFNYNNIQKNNLKELFKKLRNSNSLEEIKCILSDIRYSDYNIKGKIEPKDEQVIKSFLETENDEIKSLVIGIIAELYGGQYRDYYFYCIYEEKNIEVVESSIQALLHIFGDKILDEIKINKCTKEKLELINKYKDE
jgi:hypothetical protein